MSITDELREYTEKQIKWLDMTKVHYHNLFAIADRIDAEHQKAIRELNNLADASVLLPVDADGEYIHVGDEMELVSYDEDYRPVIRTVDAVGEQVFFAWSKANGRYAQYEACAYRHYHAPTVEDVLTEFGIDWEHESDCEDRAALLKEYASKLRLAKGVDA